MTLDWHAISGRLEAELISRRMSVYDLADEARLSVKTIQRVKDGKPARLHTVRCLERALQVNLTDESPAVSQAQGIAPEEYGGYNVSAYSHYVGHYYLFRNSYDFPDRTICAQFEIYEDRERGCLMFRETQKNKRSDGRTFSYQFSGPLLMPAGVSVIQFAAETDSALQRIITTTAMHGQTPPYLKGVLVGINELEEIGYYPAATPVYIEKIEERPPDEDPNVGSFPKDDFWHKTAREALGSAAGKFFCAPLRRPAPLQ